MPTVCVNANVPFPPTVFLLIVIVPSLVFVYVQVTLAPGVMMIVAT